MKRTSVGRQPAITANRWTDGPDPRTRELRRWAPEPAARRPGAVVSTYGGSRTPCADVRRARGRSRWTRVFVCPAVLALFSRADGSTGLYEGPGHARHADATGGVALARKTGAAAGAVRVIVQLCLETESSSHPQPIAEAREALLRELAGTRHVLRRVYTALPLVELTAAPEGLRVLQRSALTAAIHVET
jgi:hypothetical protein